MAHGGEGSIWQERAAKIFCFGVVIFGIWMTLGYAASVAAVTILVWIVSAFVHSLACRTAKRLRISRKVCAFFYVLLLLAAMGGLIFAVIRRLLGEWEELSAWVGSNGQVIGNAVDTLWKALEALPARLPFGEGVSEVLARWEVSAEGVISGLLNQGITGMGGYLTGSLGRLLRSAPEGILTWMVAVMGCFYLSMDYESVRDRLLGLLPPLARDRIGTFRQKAGKAIRGYVRAYVILLTLTFLVVFAGLVILRQRYALLLALLVAVVDLLPVLGAGTVLIPWAIAMMVFGQYFFGFGLLIVYGVVTIVRQIAEPRLIGSSLGLHPLASLFAVFAGAKLFGFAGVILGPIAAFVVKELVWDREGKEH